MSEQRSSFLGRYSLGARLAMAIFGLLFVAGLSYGFLRMQGHGREAAILTKLAVTAKNIQDLAESLDNYYSQTKSYLPMAQTADGPTLDTEGWGKRNPHLLSRFITGSIDDPFSKGGKTPLRYWSDGQSWTIWSIGPDGAYNLTDPKIYGFPGPEAYAAMEPFIYNYAKGVTSNGDLVQIYRPAPAQ